MEVDRGYFHTTVFHSALLPMLRSANNRSSTSVHINTCTAIIMRENQW